jgi:hypothetical protein
MTVVDDAPPAAATGEPTPAPTAEQPPVAERAIASTRSTTRTSASASTYGNRRCG